MDAKLAAWYAHRQGLDGSLAGRAPAEVLERGWVRSLGGSSTYLSLFSRAGTSREAADAAVAAVEIHELPAARGCTFVVPASDFALALRCGRRFSDGEMRVALKLGVTPKEIEKLQETVLKALSKGPLDPDGIREAAGGAVRSLGPAGKAKGMTTTLPLALGLLQEAGEIRRVPINGRLDQQRFKYALWKPNPLRAYKLSDDEVAIELARRFFSWIGPATLKQFQAFSGLGVKASMSAVEPLKLQPIEPASDLLLLPENRDAFAKFKVPKEPCYTLVSSLDGTGLLRGEDWPHHAILDRGMLVGYWEYATATESVVWKALNQIKSNKPLNSAISDLEKYVKSQLQDVRIAPLDSPASRTSRIAALRSKG